MKTKFTLSILLFCLSIISSTAQVYSKKQVDDLLIQKPDASDTYNKGQVDNKVDSKPTSVPDIASLIALPRGNVSSVQVQDAFRGGLFTYKPSSSGLTVDNGLVFRAADGSYIVRQFDQKAIDPRWYGAVIDGVTDDTDAWNRAIDAARYNYCRVIVPKGTSLVSTLITNGVTLVGSGMGVSYLKQKDGVAAPILQVPGGNTGIQAYPFYGFDSFSLSAGNATTDFIYFAGRIDNNVIFHDIQFRGFAGTVNTNGLSCQDYLNLNMQGVRWDGVGGYGIVVRDGSVFAHGHLVVDQFSYDNANTTIPISNSWGKGLLYIDMSTATLFKGVVAFTNGRIEINYNLASTKPAKSIFRFVQNSAYTEAAGPQVELKIENVSVDVNPVSKDAKLVSCNYRDIVFYANASNCYGLNEIYNNDTQDSKQALISNPSVVSHLDRISLLPTRYNQPTVGRISQHFGLNESSFDSDANLFGFAKTGDSFRNSAPYNTGGRVGRSFTKVAVQNRTGYHSLVGNTLGTGSINAGSNQLTFSAALSNITLPGIALDIPGAGNAGATLQAIIQSVDYPTNTATISTTAITSVSSVSVTVPTATIGVVPLVFYGTAVPAVGTYQAGDILQRTDIPANYAGPVEWECVAGGTPGTWRVSKYLTGKSTTANRPTLTANDIGVQYLDTSLNPDGQLIYWNGTKWMSVSNYLSGSASYTPGTIASGTQVQTTITVTGAALGQFTRAAFSLDLQGCVMTSSVSSTNTVTVIIRNNTAGSITLGAGTLNVRVE